jgi:hypothetical protein
MAAGVHYAVAERGLLDELSTHTHECPRCVAKWECGEANYQDECPYPTRTLCTKCWAQEVSKTCPST